MEENTEALELLSSREDEITPAIRCLTYFLQGTVLTQLGRQDEAMAAYRRSIEDPKCDTPGNAWNNLGVSYAEKGEHDKAIQAYLKALEDPKCDMPSYAWYNLGVALRIIGKYEEAREGFENARNAAEADSALESMAKAQLELLESELNGKALSRDDRAMLDRPGTSTSVHARAEQRILSKIQAAKQSQYENYLQRQGSDRDNVLSILRGWSSAVTLLEGSERVWRGGGYFIKWQGKGIVIDPGLDFLRNLHDAGYHGREIDAVLVSHNHSDHNADLGSIDDLRYELYKRRKSDPHGGVSPYVLLWDEDSKAGIKFSAEQPEHQYRPSVFDIGRCIPSDTIRRPHDLPFSVTYFHVIHGDLHSATGFRVTLHDGKRDVLSLGYTGDTEFFDELPKRLKGCDILLAHISQPDAEEFTDAKARKKIHLGYRGLAELVRLAEPKLTLVGEFWAGLADLRIDLVQGLRRLAGTNAILPAGLGMHISLPSMEIECSECKVRTPFGEIRVAPPSSQFGNLSYLCPRCLLQ